MANNFQNRIDNVSSALASVQKNLSVPHTQNNPTEQNPDEPVTQQQGKTVETSNHIRLNALDSTLLENEAYNEIEDDNFKAEYRISYLEKKIKILDNDIKNAQNINDLQKVDILTMRKHSLQKELRQLQEKYGNADITTKLSEDITNILSSKPTVITRVLSNFQNFLSQNILSKISKSFNNNQDVKAALAKLKTLNKNVDELINMQTPYGEADEWYDKLSDYLNTANVINFQISKTVGTPTFFDTINSIDKEKLSKRNTRKNSSNFNNMAGKPPF